MKLRFSPPSVTTLVQEVPRLVAWRRRIEGAARKGVVFWDESLPLSWLAEIPGSRPLPAGESCKRWHVLEAALTHLAAARLPRTGSVIAVGGGATCDLTAMAASLYRRGVDLILAPTTLLSVIDAGVGGKTAVDLEESGRLLKNFAGSFHPAREVWICPEVLVTLSERERRSGVGELLKMLWISRQRADLEGISAWIREGRIARGFWRQVRQALAAKVRIVERDPLDRKGIRAALNYGHTVGHAMESLAGGKLSHGEAVAWGMWVESALVDRKFAQEVRQALQFLDFADPRSVLAGDRADWEFALEGDKKSDGKKISLKVATGRGLREVRKTPAQIADAARAFL
ncbi:MAG: 3-dehydroquinate synthase [Bdellovibrionales bacterium]|nr:3-dehydroquinate synthase [Bdellovibrionales bacterium]